MFAQLIWKKKLLKYEKEKENLSRQTSSRRFAPNQTVELHPIKKKYQQNIADKLCLASLLTISQTSD